MAIDYVTTPLPDGATLITFSDVTDTKRAQQALIGVPAQDGGVVAVRLRDDAEPKK